MDHENPNPMNAVYVGPDSVVLKKLTDFKKMVSSDQLLAYQYERAASNFIAQFMLVKAAAEKRHIIHDTTSTNPRVKSLYAGLRKLGYSIKIYALFASAKDRHQALEKRAQKKLTVTPEDIVGKVKPVLQRLFDAYLKYADHICVLVQPHGFATGSKGAPLQAAEFSKEGSLTYLNKPVARSILEHIEEVYEDKCELRDAKQSISSLFKMKN